MCTPACVAESGKCQVSRVRPPSGVLTPPRTVASGPRQVRREPCSRGSALPPKRSRPSGKRQFSCVRPPSGGVNTALDRGERHVPGEAGASLSRPSKLDAAAEALGPLAQVLQAEAGRVPVAEGLVVEAEAQAVCLRSDDMREAIQAFVEQRRPDYSGR